MERQIQFTFDKVTMKKIATGAGIAAGGAILTYLAEHLSELNFGASTPIIVAVMSILINVCREWIKGDNK